MRIDGSKVGIIGGSIAGCATAIAATRLGADVTVFERSSATLRDRGSGIAIPITLCDELKTAGYLLPTIRLGHRVAGDGSPPMGQMPGMSGGRNQVQPG